MEVFYLQSEGSTEPTYATPGSSGMDLSAAIVENIRILPGERVLVPTGISLELPSHLEAQVRSRSGLAVKNGVVVLNSPGTIDSDYRGEIKVILINLSSTTFLLEPGMRIAQLVFSRVERVKLIPTESISNTYRGSGGFGSTGI